MRIIIIITANNDGSWAEVVLPVQTADARSSPAVSRWRATSTGPPETRGSCPTTGPREGPCSQVDKRRRRGLPVLASSVGCEPVSRPGCGNRFSIASTLHPLRSSCVISIWGKTYRRPGSEKPVCAWYTLSTCIPTRCISESLSR